MRRISGQTLSEALERLAFLPDAAARHRERSRLLTAFLRACLAIDYAHSRGVIHRDIKPDNLMLGEFGELYVLDWGVAKVCAEVDDPLEDAEPGTPDGLLTEGLGALGTPAFMSPEQHADATAVTPRSDVYALGAVLFQLLTGQPLRSGTTWPTGAALHPSAHNPDLPPEYDAICRRACAMDASMRFDSARALHDAVEAVQQGNRDLALRRTLARDHVSRALSARSESVALREVGRAISLDPTNTEAVSLLASHLLAPAEADPEAMQQERQTTESADRQRLLVGTGLTAQAMLLIGLLVVALHPILRPGLLIILFVSLFTALNAMLFGRSGVGLLRPVIASIGLSVGLVTSATLAGPWILPPLAATMGCTMFASVVSIQWRRLVIASLLLTYAGLLAATILFGERLGLMLTEEGLLIAPVLLAFDPVWTLPGISLVLFLGTLCPTVLIWKNTNIMLDSRQKLHRYEWRLRQLTATPLSQSDHARPV